MDLIAESTSGGDVVTGDKMSQSNNLNEAFRSLATLAIELARFVMAPTTSLLARDVTPVREALDDVIGWRALLAEDCATRRPELGARASSGEAARTAVEATKRRYEAMQHCMCYSCQMERYGGVVHTKTDALACPKLRAMRVFSSAGGFIALEADDSRVTDGHKCCGGKPDCGCGG